LFNCSNDVVDYCSYNTAKGRKHTMRGYCGQTQRADGGRLSDPPQGIQEPLVVRDRDGRPHEDPLVVHCFCLRSGSALLGDLIGVSRSMERDLSILWIYPRICFAKFAFIVYGLLLRFLSVLYSTVLLFWFRPSCQYLPSDWLERLLALSALHEARRDWVILMAASSRG